MSREVVVRRRKMHDGQLRLKGSRARFRVAMFGRRWGKNVAGIDEAMEDALNGKRVGWFEPTYKYFVEAWRDICTRLAPVTKQKDDAEKRLELLTGGIIEGWTCDTPDPARGRAYHKVIVNEAGIIRNLLAIWQESIRPTLTDFGGRALFLGTPKGRTHDFSMLHAKASSDQDWEAFRGPTSDNPWIPKSEIEAARRDLPPQVFAQEYEGIPADDGGNPFGLDAIKACTMTDDQWAKAKKAEPVAWGWDFARAQDYTVGIGVGRHYEVTRLARWTMKPWHETYDEVTKATGRTPSWGDSTGIGDVVLESLQRRGCPIQGVQFTGSSRPSAFAAVTAGTKQKLMERLASAIQGRTIRFPAGVVASELETFGYEYTRNGVRYTAPEGFHDDCVVALALAVYGRDHVVIEDIPTDAFEPDTHPGFTAWGERVMSKTEKRYKQQQMQERGQLVEANDV